MNVNEATGTALLPGQTKPIQKSLDKDSFLMLLVAQLQSQDPTSNQDPNAMVQQMTSFSMLEQSKNTNSLLEGIQTQNNGMFQAQAAGLVGKQVKVTSPYLDLKSGSATVGVDVAAEAEVTLQVKDAQGKTVAVLPQGSHVAGSFTATWNGRDASGNLLPDGSYTVEVTATGADGKAVPAATTGRLKVDAVLFQGGAIFLMAGGRRFSLADVSEIAA